MFSTDSQGSGNFPVMVHKGYDDRPAHDGWGQYMWAVVIVVIFLVIIFFAFALMFARRKEHDGIGEIAPIAAAAMLSNKPVVYHEDGGYKHDYGHMEHWDIVRDELREFGNIKMEVKENGWTQCRENDRNHYEASRQADQNTYRLEKEIGEVKAEVCASERRTADLILKNEMERIKAERDAARLEASNLRFHWKPAIFGPPADLGCAAGY